MKNVFFDASPLRDKNKLRGVGYYTKNLLAEFVKREEYLKKSGFLVRSDFKKGERVDLVHYPFFDPFFLTLPFSGGGNFLVTVHDLIPIVFEDHYPRGVRGDIKWQIQMRKLLKAKAVITDSDCSKRDIERIIPELRGRVHRVYLACSEEFEKKKGSEEIRGKYQLPEKFFLYIGDVNYNKNVGGLIEGYSEFLKVGGRNSEYRLVIGGGVFKDSNLKETKEVIDLVSKMGLGENVVFCGQLGLADLVDVYNLADFYVQPSFYEGFGLPVLEAQSCGVVVVSSFGGSLKEVGGEGALYFDPTKKEDMAEKMVKVINDSRLREKLIEKGFENLERFSWEKTMEETVKIYQKALE